jgi:hypothetical protein
MFSFAITWRLPYVVHLIVYYGKKTEPISSEVGWNLILSRDDQVSPLEANYFYSYSHSIFQNNVLWCGPTRKFYSNASTTIFKFSPVVFTGIKLHMYMKI